MNDESVLKADDLHFDYHPKHAAALSILRGVSLSIRRGESVAIVGTSGSGKSTLLHLLGGLDTPNRGALTLCGEDFSAAGERQRTQLRGRHLGFVYQFHHLLAEFTTAENVAMPLKINGVHARKAIREATALLEKIGLGDRLDHKPAALSGGERQRVAIARALIHRPDCLLADEPTGNLDQDTAANVFSLMHSLVDEHGGAMIVVTHDLALARRMDRCFQLSHGRLEAAHPRLSDAGSAVCAPARATDATAL